VKSAARGPLSSVVMLGHRIHTARARRAHAAGYRTFCVHDLRLSRRRLHRIPNNSLTCKPDSSGVLAPFRLGISTIHRDGSAVGVLFQSASCDCPGRASGRGRKSWMLDDVTIYTGC
jgi:hypothetical protein